MMPEMVAYTVAVQATRELAHSARPDAPVVPARQATPGRPVRRLAAVGLRRVADRLDAGAGPARPQAA